MTRPLRIVTFNVALFREEPMALVRELEGVGSAQLRAVVEVIRRLDADVLVLNELDYDDEHRALRLLNEVWLGRVMTPYPYAFTAPVNTGVPSGRDLVKDESLAVGRSSPLGFGAFPGQYGMAVLSRVPIDVEACRTFRQFLWRDMPGADLPRWPDGSAFYDADDLAVLPVSSKSHWDLVLRGEDRPFHLLVSHPTPPAFDGPERRNVCRNGDEIRFWVDYIGGAEYPVDDAGRRGGLSPDAAFVVAGDLNASPIAGDSRPGAIQALLGHARVQAVRPISPGAVGVRPDVADADQHTADWGMRSDYLLPSRHWRVGDTGVFWPVPEDPFAEVVARASDHRAVWLDCDRI
ncbi:endonuclease/exonuclease/phosphatase family protein [Saccharospirillum salsuginis]|uniref:Endonuclease n=1 Tax=Saccharospirillum salsuginis TaxID=418750 RepID=A0A918KG05_9GAMM|nr:endonuclease/exonuclease/phosphatase family protein [Saccharospirillum salsuginis]GGX59449.1 endonuclease [Saccharospirillum salsuginis]